MKESSTSSNPNASNSHRHATPIHEIAFESSSSSCSSLAAPRYRRDRKCKFLWSGGGDWHLDRNCLHRYQHLPFQVSTVTIVVGTSSQFKQVKSVLVHLSAFWFAERCEWSLCRRHSNHKDACNNCELCYERVWIMHSLARWFRSSSRKIASSARRHNVISLYATVSRPRL